MMCGTAYRLPMDNRGDAQFLRIPKATLRQWRYLGIGPKAGRGGRHLRYHRDDVITWFRERQRNAA
jgi:hypothetical protein